MNIIDFSNPKIFSNKKVLQYVREPKLGGLQFRKYGLYIAKHYLGTSQIDYISQTDQTAKYFIDLSLYSFYEFTHDDFIEFGKIVDIDKVIRNDRVFRYELPYIESLHLILSCTKYFLEFFKRNPYDLILTHMVDEFIVDILLQVADYLNIPVVAFCGSSFGSNYIRITRKGETNLVWTPTEAEVNEFFKYLSETNAKPLVKSKSQVQSQVLKYYFLYKIKLLYHYYFLYKLLGKGNYRYMMTRAQTYPKRLSYIFGIQKYFSFTRNLEEELDPSKTVYIPLHYHPEATTDYWISEPNYLTYYPSLVKTIKYFSESGYTILLKEHTASYFQRDPQFLKKISSLPGVILLSPFVSTYEAFQLADFVVVWTGTTGVEAIMQNKKVLLAEGETYYSLGELSTVGKEEEAKFPTEEFKRKVANHVLSGLLPYALN